MKWVRRILTLVVPILVLSFAGWGTYELAFSSAKPKKIKIDGVLVQLPQEFIVNLAGGRYGKVSVSLLMPAAPPVAAFSGRPVPKQYDAVRAVITDELTGLDSSELIVRSRRHRLVARLKTALERRTDEHVKAVLLTDIAIQ